ncbi:formylglycine-generating enzyme family protein [Pararhodospirillum oryzae]|uniref:Sulfatase-modifying factor enzyme-like domain-containing protein n=1 Tax=Pararhodospirillum oryzae TaxID=478448 RepID=A0A512H8E3_9PROT|nr:SUMF1/EgtB/PvdO family nonheme iron enzyme [Pararhodospirillum oryzae]GEO81725.1 hypothetical protein ROR02_18560 [Pararhodospirillum oryzae]
MWSDLKGLLSGVVVLGALSPGAGAWAGDGAPIAWAEKYWNPGKADGDVVIPLPCGGGMAFRVVRTDVGDNWLADQPFKMGQWSERSAASGGESADALAYSQYQRNAYLAGSLSQDGESAHRYFLMGKYEVTRDQYKAVMEETCPTAKTAGRTPVDNISWFDAVHFTQRLTEWLMVNSPPSLPKEEGVHAFVRLPTEEEWEFTVRGGQAVTPDEFLADRFPMPEGVSQYIWYQGSDSCRGDLQVIGLHKPNPLGVHDMLGNVQEMMLEPFHMVRPGRPHGQVGGLVYRGGSCQIGETQITSAFRFEASYYEDSTGKARAQPMAGFRVLIAGPVVTGHDRLARIKADWNRVSDLPGVSLEGGPAEQLEKAATVVENSDLSRQLLTIATTVRREAAERQEINERAIQSNLRAGALTIRQYRDEMQRQNKIKAAMDVNAGGSASLDKEYADSLMAIKARMRLTQGVYTWLLARTAEDFKSPDIQSQATAVSRQLREIDAVAMADFAVLFATQAQRWAREGGGDVNVYLAELLSR